MFPRSRFANIEFFLKYFYFWHILKTVWIQTKTPECVEESRMEKSLRARNNSLSRSFCRAPVLVSVSVRINIPPQGRTGILLQVGRYSFPLYLGQFKKMLSGDRDEEEESANFVQCTKYIQIGIT